MRQHGLPVLLQCGFVCFHVPNSWWGNSFVSAFLCQDILNNGRGGLPIVAKQVDDIIQIPWPAALPQRPDFLAKDFWKVITVDVNACIRSIGIRMKGFLPCRRKNQHFVGGQVEFNFRQVFLTAYKITSVIDTRFARLVAARIFVDIE